MAEAEVGGNGPTFIATCSPTTTETTVTLRATNGRFTAVEATGATPAVRKCVERALASQPTVFDGTCTTTIVHGRK